ncbi:transcriptional regulator, AraC family domain protein, partial [Listeria seeligeri FSL S4-171]
VPVWLLNWVLFCNSPLFVECFGLKPLKFRKKIRVITQKSILNTILDIFFRIGFHISVTYNIQIFLLFF